jgi:Xaa-Pro aminopeptidase
VVLVPGAREQRRNGTNTYPFRQSSDLLYLTGFDEPDAVAVFRASSDQRHFSLFLKPRDKVREQWTGSRLGTDEAPAVLGCDAAYEVSELESRLAALIDGCHTVYAPLGEDEALDALLLRVLKKLRSNERNGSRAPQRIADLSSVLHELRMRKDEDSLRCMRRAAAITCEAHLLAMAAARSGRREFHIRALIDYAFARENGIPGYDTIVGAGANATVLHYTSCGDELRAGELLLVDAGCEWGHHTADVTRTYPIAGADGSGPQWSTAQRRLYDVVLSAQRAGIDAARPGCTIEEVHAACVRVATQGLVDLGLLPKTSDLADLIERGEHRRYYVHRTSHFLGMDVHDVGAYFPDSVARALQPGTVFTIEPGLYIRSDAELPSGCEALRGCGVRIEDDVLIREPESGMPHEVLTAACPKDPDELLRLVGRGVTIAL